MGNREDLLAGALQCLKDKGWAGSTVRDIAAAAGVNHAAIGYHFGSREALLTEALMQAMEQWGAEIGQAVMAALTTDASPRERYEAFWRQVILAHTNNRRLWLTSIEAAVQAERNPAIRELMAKGLREGRSGLAANLLGIPEDALGGTAAQTVGAIQMGLMTGLLMQWALDPEQAPDEHDITDGLIGLTALITGTQPAGH
ncbi:TetR/AcrR family transcriptional regulator [Amycolatopsis cynarae]|uniref:TetR/AcrR family transcriptional regulator n=1 Tax=Amycolatopsis cynarae TaxID=2995223 RepID=A0ABY7AXP1_9PSEU|nr:TetR/AcrR family transcriptional regulator [Amycolatopsis sp. HUAS 11-8]WAL63778.1 TetR/AcrR family transcriptional regulator [Amycolatopsis sp. HUAS 11-8]